MWETLKIVFCNWSDTYPLLQYFQALEITVKKYFIILLLILCDVVGQKKAPGFVLVCSITNKKQSQEL